MEPMETVLELTSTWTDNCVKNTLLLISNLLASKQMIPTEMSCETVGIFFFLCPLKFLHIQRLKFYQSTIYHGQCLIAVFLDTTTSH